FQDNPMSRVFAPAHRMIVEITNASDPIKNVITVKEQSHSGGRYTTTIDVKMSGNNEILINLIEGRIALGKPVSLQLRFRYHPETGFAPIREVMEGRNNRIKEFYYRLWFGDEKMPLDASVTDVFDGGQATV